MRDGIVCGLCHRYVHLGGPLTKDCTSCGKLYRQLLSPAKTEPMPHDGQVFTGPEFERNSREA